MSWVQSGFISTQLWAAAVCEVPGRAHCSLLGASLHHRTFYYIKMYKTVAVLFVGTGAESPCPGLTHPLWLPGHRRRFLNLLGSQSHLFPWNPWVLPFQPGQNWRMEAEDCTFHIAAQPLLMCQQLFYFLEFGWLCWGKMEMFGLVFSPYLKKNLGPTMFLLKFKIDIYIYIYIKFLIYEICWYKEFNKNAGRRLSIVMLYKPGFGEVYILAVAKYKLLDENSYKVWKLMFCYFMI